ncbi:ABC transporter ATP-binding protein [Neoroseomonas oryzicola]|uniref:ABC transporter ATP-binding protein n=1 Tax=Neoroseomonas oryzicola TaxID=535904 RepID=A0A9X9WBM3_9PROT|nr:ABC transporter ATP-binding protein [Neoroseomonas oryzicola]MBR0657733.1 ABC transporter ATP-binding protein [Neoroseomonas oryzicola]NKE18989.1 ABC transporter ATP-binding protein [Neoroseomonas oryzicola]
MSLVVRGITKAWGGFRALDGVSFEMESTGLLGIIGPNGAGKSTLFSVVSGFIPADVGSVALDGTSLDRLGPAARARAGMIRTFQVPREFHHLTVRENLMAAAPGQSGEGLLGLFLRPGRVRAEEDAIRAEAEATIDFLRLAGVADTPAGRLSGGQKKLVELGRALMAKPRLILLDEPFAGVNPVLIEEIMARIRDLNGRGIGFLVIEHDLDALSRLVPRVVVMDRGRVLATGTPQAVLADAAVREAYLGGAPA